MRQGAPSVALTSAAISADGELAALGDARGFVTLMTTREGRWLGRIAVGSGEVNALSFRPGSSDLLALTKSGQLSVIDVTKASVHRSASTGEVTTAAFSPDATLLAVAVDDGFSIWPTAGGSARRASSKEHGLIRTLTFSRDGRSLVSAASTVCTWDATAPKACRVVHEGENADIAAYGSDGLLFVGIRRDLRWLGADLRREFEGEMPDRQWSALDSVLAITPPGFKKAIIGQRIAAFAPLASGQALAIATDGLTYTITDHGATITKRDAAEVVASSQDGRFGLTAHSDASGIRTTLWDGMTAKVSKTFMQNAIDPVERVATVSDHVAVFGMHDRVWAFDWSTSAMVPVLRLDGTLASLSEDARMLVARKSAGVDENDALIPWDVRAGVPLKPLAWMPKSKHGDFTVLDVDKVSPLLGCARVSPGCKVLIGGAWYGDPVSGKLERKFVDAQKTTLNPPRGTDDLIAAMSADGRHIARAVDRGSRSKVEVIDVASNVVEGTFDLPGSTPALAFDEKGSRLLVANHPIEHSSAIIGDAPVFAYAHVFEVSTGKELARIELAQAIQSVTLSGDGRTGYVGGWGNAAEIYVLDIDKGSIRQTLRGHEASVKAMVVPRSGTHLVSSSEDGSARVWNLATGQSVALVFDNDDWLAYTDDGYFDASRRGERLVAATNAGRVIALEQLAMSRNRPDVLLERLGHKSGVAHDYFAARHAERLRKAGLREDQLASEYLLSPQVRIVELRREGKFADLTIDLTSRDGNLATYNVYDNGVPLLGTTGRRVDGSHARVHERVELTAGSNHLEVSATARNGLKGPRDSRDETYDGTATSSIFYLGFGHSGHGVSFAHKDAEDLGNALNRLGTTVRLSKAIPEEEITIEGIRRAKELLRAATPDDTVVVLVAGHGKHLDHDLMFLTHDADPMRPETWAPRSLFDELLDSTPARKKLLLVDTCESGEELTPPPGEIEREPFPGLGAKIGLHDRYVYNDLTRATGAVTLSAARGYERSKESSVIHNGYFTYEIIKALQGAADSNKNGRLSIDELTAYTTAMVSRWSASQHPTLDRENRSADSWLPVLPPPPGIAPEVTPAH